MAIKRFQNRMEAGKQLAASLEAYAHHPDAIVLALPRGGVPVGFAVASELGLPLDIMLVRKLGTPGQEELAMGAIASGGERVLANDVIQMMGITDKMIDAAARRETVEIERREHLYRSGRPPLRLRDRTVILVDDGLATGSTMLAAVQAVRKQHPSRVVVAVPVGASDTCYKLGAIADEVVCDLIPEPFHAVGLWYENFAQTTDDEVNRLLDEAQRQQAARQAAGMPGSAAGTEKTRHPPG